MRKSRRQRTIPPPKPEQVIVTAFLPASESVGLEVVIAAANAFCQSHPDVSARPGDGGVWLSYPASLSPEIVVSVGYGA